MLYNRTEAGYVLSYDSSTSFCRQRQFVALLLAGLGACCVSLAFIPKDITAAVLVVFVLGRMCAGGSFAMAYILSTELFPTNLRRSVWFFNGQEILHFS